MEQTQKQKNGFTMKLATFIVNKRNLFLLITIILLVFSAFSRNWVEVENDQTAYLPASCETKQALNVMSDQFTTCGTAEVMLANITYDEAEALSGRISAVKGVQSVAFDETSGHYARASTLFTVTFDRDETDDACLTSLDAVKELLADYEKEAALLTELESRGEIDHAVGLANTEAMDGCMLADKLTPRQFSELAGLDYEMAQVVYAAEQGDYGKLMGNIASYKVPLIDMFLFVCGQADAGIIQLDAEQMSMLSAAARSSQCCSCCSFCRRFCCSAADWRIRPASPCPPPRGRTSRASVCLSSALCPVRSAAQSVAAEAETVSIGSLHQLQAFAKRCGADTYSRD